MMDRAGHLGLLLLVAGGASLLGAIPVFSAQHVVRPDGLGDFPTIQQAVDAAVPGDEILLEDGLFEGVGNRDITFAGKDLIVRSRNGAAACTIDAGGSLSEPHRAFRLDDGETQAARIDGITITGGYTTGPFPEVGGAGILITTNTSPTIANCIFDGNESGFQGFGAGLLAYDGCDVTITDCVFRNGTSGWYGGGFTLRLDSDGIVERCLVTDNFALHGGGGVSITNSDALVTDCLFLNNEVVEAGGGGVLVKAGARPIFTRCVIAGNHGAYAGGLGMGNFPEVTMIDCLFEGNTAGFMAGAIHVDYEASVLHLQNCTLVNNHSPGVALQVLVGTGALFTMHNSILRGSCGSGLQIYCSSGTVEVDCNLIQGGGAAIGGNGVINYGPDNRDLDPLFCAPRSCDAPVPPVGDWTIDALSPAAPAGSPCGAIGAYPVACGASDVPASWTPTSWGRLKGLYR